MKNLNLWTIYYFPIFISRASLFTVFLVWLADSLLFIYIFLFAWPTYLTDIGPGHCPGTSFLLPSWLPSGGCFPPSALLPLLWWQDSGHVLHIIAFKALQTETPLNFPPFHPSICPLSTPSSRSAYWVARQMTIKAGSCLYAMLSMWQASHVITALLRRGLCGRSAKREFFMQTFRSCRSDMDPANDKLVGNKKVGRKVSSTFKDFFIFKRETLWWGLILNDFLVAFFLKKTSYIWLMLLLDGLLTNIKFIY